MQSELETEILSIFQISHQIKILLGECHTRAGRRSSIIKDDKVLSGDIAIDKKDFPA